MESRAGSWDTYAAFTPSPTLFAAPLPSYFTFRTTGQHPKLPWMLSDTAPNYHGFGALRSPLASSLPPAPSDPTWASALRTTSPAPCMFWGNRPLVWCFQLHQDKTSVTMIVGLDNDVYTHLCLSLIEILHWNYGEPWQLSQNSCTVRSLQLTHLVYFPNFTT